MKNKLIAIIIVLFSASIHAALVSNRYDTNSDAVAAALVNAQATAAANVVVNTNNTITPLGATLTVLFGASGATYLQGGGLTISNTATPAHPTVISSDGGIHTYGYINEDAGGIFSSAGLNISCMYLMGADTTYGMVLGSAPGTPSYLFTIFTPFDNGYQTNATFPAGLPSYNLDACGEATWLFPKTGLYTGTWSTRPFLSWGVITSGVTNWSGYSFDGTTATLGPMTSTAGPVTPAFSWTQNTNNKLTSASIFNGAIQVTNLITTRTNFILSSNFVQANKNGLYFTNRDANSWVATTGAGGFWLSNNASYFAFKPLAGVIVSNMDGFVSTNWIDHGTNTYNTNGLSTTAWASFNATNTYPVMGSNAAPFVPIISPITLNVVYSNSTGVGLRGKIDYSLTDSAISGAPCILCTNLTRPWYTILSNNFVLAGVTYGAYKFDLEPAGTVLFTNLSSGSATATIFNSELHYP